MRCGRYGRQAVQTLLSGQHLTLADFTAARAAALTLKAQIAAILVRHDAVATANVLSTAPPFSDFAGDRATWTAMRTLPYNITGHPALALPIGFHHGLPMGMQLIGRDHHEDWLCQIGDAFERATDHSALKPGP